MGMNCVPSYDPKLAPRFLVDDSLSYRSYFARLSLEPIVLNLERRNQKDDQHDRSYRSLESERKSCPSEDHESSSDITEKVRPQGKDNRSSLSSLWPSPNVTDTAAQKTEG